MGVVTSVDGEGFTIVTSAAGYAATTNALVPGAGK